MRYAAVVLSLLLVWTLRPSAQTPAARPIEESRFDVVSVKPVPMGASLDDGGYRPEPTRFRGKYSVAFLTSFAYQVADYRVTGGPDWTRKEGYEITASIAGTRQRDDVRFMIRHLLEDRFRLKVHRELRPMPVYALFMSRSDGRLGPQLQRVERDCSNASSGSNMCAFGWGGDGGRYHAGGQQWSAFVGLLELMSGRPIVDRTALSGQFDVKLEWNPNPSPFSNAGSTLSEQDQRPILFTALQEQLGLKLEPATEPIDVLVIDSIERPTPD